MTLTFCRQAHQTRQPYKRQESSMSESLVTVADVHAHDRVRDQEPLARKSKPLTKRGGGKKGNPNSGHDHIRVIPYLGIPL